jgi:hypothetical protein
LTSQEEYRCLCCQFHHPSLRSSFHFAAMSCKFVTSGTLETKTKVNRFGRFIRLFQSTEIVHHYPFSLFLIPNMIQRPHLSIHIPQISSR